MLNQYVWAHNVVTSYSLNRADQFPVDFRLYLQFCQKKGRAVLAELAHQVRRAPTLHGYQRYLVSLLAYRVRQEQYQPKTQLAAALIRQAVAWGLPFDVVLFDGWYCRWPLIQVVQDLHKDWVRGCPKDRWVLFQNRCPPRTIAPSRSMNGCGGCSAKYSQWSVCSTRACASSRLMRTSCS